MKRSLLFTFLILGLLAAAPSEKPPIYSNNFSKAELGKLPDADLLALAGTFEVKDVEGNRLLELAGTPLDSLGALFGPAPGQASCTVSARIWADVTGKRVPEFGIGANDTGGYKLWLMPRQKKIVIRKADATVARSSYNQWEPATWTSMRLEVAKRDNGEWVVRGKAWKAGTEEPKDWTLSFDENEGPTAGRASIWANPYSEKPIRLDDLHVDQ